MDKLNYDILIENIEMLMRNKNIIQATLIRETGIPQSQMSKALNRTAKNRFTFEQIVKIADYFEVSIDFLIGRNLAPAPVEQLSNKEICKTLMQLIENDILSYMEVSPTEIHFVEEPPQMPYDPPYAKKTGPVTYTGFYFSKYFQFNDWLPEDYSEYGGDYFYNGNILEKNEEINNFLKYYFQLSKLLKNGDMPKEIFDQAIADRLDKLSK